MILDPMSGYGTITSAANLWGSATYCIELNMPSYLWQYLTLPSNKKKFIDLTSKILASDDFSYRSHVLSEWGTDWISPNGFEILDGLYDSIISLCPNRTDLEEQSVIALLLPFVTRVSTVSLGDVNHVKRGGLAVYKGYESDFKTYIKLLSNKISSIPSNNLENVLIYGDSTDCDMDDRLFNTMVTSPPYPNSTDYQKMFGAENYYLDHLRSKKKLHIPKKSDHIIGTNVVSGYKSGKIRSETVNEFIDWVASNNKTGKSMADARVYYVPYFKNYFYDLQSAYDNVERHLEDHCKGSIVVRDNTRRGHVVPLSQFIKEFWESKGFIVKESFKEVPHVGSKNPSVKGRSALHSEYIIDIER